jgi:hypothetical protein
MRHEGGGVMFRKKYHTFDLIDGGNKQSKPRKRGIRPWGLIRSADGRVLTVSFGMVVPGPNACA